MFRGLRTQLLLWTILPLAVILIVVAYVGVSGHQATMRDMVYERDAALARVVANEWSQSLATHATLLPTLDPRQGMPCGTGCAAFDGGIALYDSAAHLVIGQPSPQTWYSRQARVAAFLAQPGATFSMPFV